MISAATAQRGIRENWIQFALLVLVNFLGGGLVGLERSIFPEFADLKFGIASKTAILSFIVAFGISKAIANYYAGRLSNKMGRRNLLIAGWLFALPIPFLLIYAPNWGWVVFANVLLGINQGLAWSSTLLMKIDLAKEKERGMAAGINEFSGYLAVGLLAFVSGYLAKRFWTGGWVRPEPFYVGIGLAVLGLFLTIIWVKDTRKFVRTEQKSTQTQKLEGVFWETSFKNKSLSTISFSGLVNNLNDGMIWGLLPILLLSQFHYNTDSVGIITAVYPAVWGFGQLFTGRMADLFSKKKILFIGMLLQGLVILLIPFNPNFYVLIVLAALLGLGTALVYPTFTVAVAERTTPNQRAESIGVFRLWRDLGYAFGAIIAGVVADLFGITFAMCLVGFLTIGASLLIRVRME